MFTSLESKDQPVIAPQGNTHGGADGFADSYHKRYEPTNIARKK